jgi:hypothetical protein
MLIRENNTTAPITIPMSSSRGMESSAMGGGSYGFESKRAIRDLKKIGKKKSKVENSK